MVREHGSSQTTIDDVRKRVDERLSKFRATDPCVLIGGPPCQAYSLVGRSCNKGIADYVFEKDTRVLYRAFRWFIGLQQGSPGGFLRRFDEVGIRHLPPAARVMRGTQLRLR